MSITVARAMPIVKSQLHAKNSRKSVWCNVGPWEPVVSVVPVGPGDRHDDHGAQSALEASFWTPRYRSTRPLTVDGRATRPS